MSEVTNEKAEADNNNVLTITRPSPARQVSNQSINVMSTIEDIDSTHSMTPPPTAHNEKFPNATSSPYYNLRTPASESKQNINAVHPFDQDLEAQILTQQKTEASQSKTGLLKKKCTTTVDPAWPGRDQLKMRKKQLKREKACCGWWVAMSSRKKTMVKVLVFLVVVALATGLGIGISRALNTGVWTKSGSNTPIQ